MQRRAQTHRQGLWVKVQGWGEARANVHESTQLCVAALALGASMLMQPFLPSCMQSSNEDWHEGRLGISRLSPLVRSPNEQAVP